MRIVHPSGGIAGNMMSLNNNRDVRDRLVFVDHQGVERHPSEASFSEYQS